MTQCERIIALINKQGSVTNGEIETTLRITSPTRRICDLREKGFDVRSMKVLLASKDGEKLPMNLYWLGEKNICQLVKECKKQHRKVSFPVVDAIDEINAALRKRNKQKFGR